MTRDRDELIILCFNIFGAMVLREQLTKKKHIEENKLCLHQIQYYPNLSKSIASSTESDTESSDIRRNWETCAGILFVNAFYLTDNNYVGFSK